jgi:cytochrome b pre-mRNA-processing protein 3
MIWRKLFGRTPDPSQALYDNVVRHARQARFYRDWGVPDTIDGRFDMIVLHLFLVLDRLQKEGQPHETLQQKLTDTFFKDMDRSLREMGVGDLSVGKKVRKMAEACFGRLKAYAAAMPNGEVSFQEALSRNILADAASGDAASLAKWALQASIALQQQPIERIAIGDFLLP